jgi:hypothetical protein
VAFLNFKRFLKSAGLHLNIQFAERVLNIWLIIIIFMAGKNIDDYATGLFLLITSRCMLNIMNSMNRFKFYFVQNFFETNKKH